MKRRKVWIHAVFLTLIALSLVFFGFVAAAEYRLAEETDDIFGGSFSVLICLFFYFPVFSFEIELYRVVRYFALSPNKRKSRTVVNIVSLLLIPLLCLTAWAAFRWGHRYSILAMELPLLLAPVHFFIMRIVAFCWWSEDSENEVSHEDV